jgi:hypothetical protein
MELRAPGTFTPTRSKPTTQTLPTRFAWYMLPFVMKIDGRHDSKRPAAARRCTGAG